MNECLSISQVRYLANSNILEVTIENISSVDFRLLNESNYSFQNNDDLFEIPAHSAKVIEVKTLKRISSINLDFNVLNALVSPKENARINLSYKIN